MGLLQDKSIDLILCDLPYGTTRNKWDSVIPLDKLWMEYERVIKDTGVIALFAQTPFDKVLGASNLKLLKYELIWEKEQGTGFLNVKKMPLKSHENILVFYKKLGTYNPQMEKGEPYVTKKGGLSSNYDKDSVEEVITVNDGYQYPKSVLRFARDKRKFHPTQKPVALLEWLIKTYTNVGGIVLDNCMGSGSTGVACVNTNRDFIGIELDTEYFNLAKTRIEEVIYESTKETNRGNCNSI